MENDAMKIVELRSENVQAVKVVELKLDAEAGLITIGGKNGAGKSSVMKSFIWALAGAGTIPEKPVREGETEAEVEIKLHGEQSEYIVRRTWTEKGTYLKVESPEGAQFKSPQAMLDGFVGDLSIDPLAFADLPASDQRETLLDVSGIREDLEDNQAKIDEVYEERREANRCASRLEGKLAGEEKPDAPNEEQSQEAVLEDLREARHEKAENDIVRDRAKDAQQAAERAGEELQQRKRAWKTQEAEVERLRVALAEAEGVLEERKADIIQQREAVSAAEENAKGAAARADALEDPDLDAIEKRLAEVEKVNQRVRERQRIAGLESELEAAQAEHRQHKEKLEALRAERQAAIAAADMPLEGISLTDDGVTYEGIPFGQLSKSEQLKVSTSMAMELNPRLHVIRIEDGSLLDEDSMAQLETLARERDYHIWIERVQTDGVSVLIEEGRLANAE